MTLVYAGAIEGREISEFNNMGKDAISAARVTGSFSLSVTGVETLGDAGEEVDVLVFHPTPQLLVARNIVESWDQSGFEEFLPHATIGPAGSAYAQRIPPSAYEMERGSRGRTQDMLPSNVFFDRLAVCWGDDRLIFNLSSYDY